MVLGRLQMRVLMTLLLLTSLSAAQTASTAKLDSPEKPTPSTPNQNQLMIPAGTKVPIALKHAISTKSSREGESVYAETTFPVVLNSRVLIPAATYVQGKISHVQRAGHVKGRAEVLMHFTTLIYPSGYSAP
jgi:type IV secretory pathway VirB10-like protein